MPTELKKRAISNEVSVTQYDITVVPNDFNINTINNLIESGGIAMPFFQRNYVWGKREASKFIESLILGLPVPQIFLYQKERNNFLVIDGQQRLLTIYYFINERFPQKNNRVKLRKIFDEHGCIPQEILSDDNYFQDFKLQLTNSDSNYPHPLNGLKYNTLGKYKSNFEFMTIRCMTIRQNDPKDDSSIFEIFSRLNTGGVNLGNQEIRACLYHSPFYLMLNKLNQNAEWRRIWGKPEEDNKSKDIEALLRVFALLSDFETYSGSMSAFINRFAKKSMSFLDADISHYEALFLAFLKACKNIPKTAFETKRGQFNIALFDSVFVAFSKVYYKNSEFIEGTLTISEFELQKLKQLKSDEEFIEAITHSTSHTSMVKARINKAIEILQ